MAARIFAAFFFRKTRTSRWSMAETAFHLATAHDGRVSAFCVTLYDLPQRPRAGQPSAPSCPAGPQDKA